MPITRIEGDAQVIGTLTPTHMNYPAGEMTDAGISSTAEIGAHKLQHEHVKSYSQPNTTATTETRPLHMARGAGTVADFAGGIIAASSGGATVTIDLKKNGSSILTAAVTLGTARVPVVATLAGGGVTSYVAGDFFEIVITATAGGGTLGTGVCAQAIFQETSVL